MNDTPATPAPIRHTAPVSCPACGHEFTGRWTGGRTTADQQCGACGHVFEATWPGFRFEPETVVYPSRAVGPPPGEAPPPPLKPETKARLRNLLDLSGES